MWSPFIPGGEIIDWAAVDQALEWMVKNACCAGCANGGGPPDCTIRICARERGYDLCSSCEDLDSCTKFEWLKVHGSQLKQILNENRGLSREECIKRFQQFRQIRGSSPEQDCSEFLAKSIHETGELGWPRGLPPGGSRFWKQHVPGKRDMSHFHPCRRSQLLLRLCRNIGRAQKSMSEVRSPLTCETLQRREEGSTLCHL